MTTIDPWLLNSGLCVHQRMLVVLVAAYTGNNRLWSPNQERLALLSGMSQTSVSRHLNSLLKSGWLLDSFKARSGVTYPCLRINPEKYPAVVKVAEVQQQQRKARAEPGMLPLNQRTNKKQILEAAANYKEFATSGDKRKELLAQYAVRYGLVTEV